MAKLIVIVFFIVMFVLFVIAVSPVLTQMVDNVMVVSKCLETLGQVCK